MLKLKKILVTGGAGFIGSHFVDLCLSQGIQVVNFDALLEGSMLEHGPEKTHANYEFNQIDLTQSFEVPDDIDAIVHFAAQTHVDRSITDTYSFVSSNILGTYNLLLKTVGKNIRFHLVSTDEVYGDVIGIDKPCDEVSNIHSSSPYSASKAGSEQLVMAWGRTFGIDYTITRGCNTIGERQNPEKLFPKFIYNAQNDIDLPVYGDGTAIRQYIHVSDHVAAIFKVLAEAESCSVWNVCADLSCSINEIVDFLRGHYPNLKTTDKENRLGHDLKYWIDNSKITNQFGWKPLYLGQNILIQSLNEIN